MRLLMHICCAPCSVACIASLRSEGLEPVGYWYNPNIHPFTEYRMRRNTLTEYADRIGLRLEVRDDYGLRDFVRNVADDIDGRCVRCYGMRLREAARFAREKDFEAFTTTLLISPYQNHELLRKTGEAAAEEFGVPFLYRDFRPLFRQGQEEARNLGLYMQKYCGCIFSEEDRYLAAKRRKKAERERMAGESHA